MAEASDCLEGEGWRLRLGGPQPLSSWTGRHTWAVSATNSHLARALPMTEQLRLPSASMEIEPHAAITVDLQQPPWELREE